MQSESGQIDALVFGLGAIGGFYAFILSQCPNIRLTVCARSNYEVVKEKGLYIDSDNHGQHTVCPYKVVKTPAEAGIKFDLIICANKAIGQDDVPSTLAPAMKDAETTIVLAQNGVGNEDPFRAAFPRNVILSCVVWVAALQDEPGNIRQLSTEKTQIGIFPAPAVISPIVEATKLMQITALFKEGNHPTEVFDNIQIQRWRKVVWNCAWNSLTTLTGLDTQSWFESSPFAVPLSKQIMTEVITVARQSGVPLEYDLVDELMRIIRSYGKVTTSMQTDAKMERPMEVEIIIGVPVRKARELGVAVPMLEVLYAVLLAINSKFVKRQS